MNWCRKCLVPIHGKIRVYLYYNLRFHTNCKHVHSCPDSCHTNQFHTSTHVLESWTELCSSWRFCAEPSSNTPARQMVHVHQKPVSQAKQTSCDKPQTFLNKSKDLNHVPLSSIDHVVHLFKERKKVGWTPGSSTCSLPRGRNASYKHKSLTVSISNTNSSVLCWRHNT